MEERNAYKQKWRETYSVAADVMSYTGGRWKLSSYYLVE